MGSEMCIRDRFETLLSLARLSSPSLLATQPGLSLVCVQRHVLSPQRLPLLVFDGLVFIFIFVLFVSVNSGGFTEVTGRRVGGD